MKFTFTNKNEYLQYRKDWKANYKQLSQQIRNFKFAYWYQQPLRADRRTLELDARYERICKQYKTNCFYTYGLKQKAKSMLAELKLAKQEAQRQYLASKEQPVQLADCCIMTIPIVG